MAAITFTDVSKRFVLRRERRTSLHERFSLLLRRKVLQDEDFWALRDVSFEIHEGETLGLIGHNGSGKSTTLKLITRILDPTSGHVGVNGRISALLELGSGFHPDLTGRENIYLNGSILGYSRAEMRSRLDEIVAFSELEQFIDMPVKHYSSGMYMRLGFSIAVSVDPDILITDEVLAVGDESFQRKCMDRIYDLKRDGRTILFVSHAMSQVQNLCDRVLWFDHGKLIQQGDPLPIIDAYMQAANRQQRERLEQQRLEHDADAPQERDEQRWGTREAEIVDLTMVGSDGQRRITFQTGEQITFQIHYRAHERITNPIFGVALHHHSGVHINGPNTRFAGFDIPAIEGEGVVEYTIPALPLLEGEYLFTAAIYNSTMTHPFDHHERKYPLHIVAAGGPDRYGLLSIPSSWGWRENRTNV